MAEGSAIDIAAVIEAQKLNRFHLLMVGFGFMIFYVQGLDSSGAAVAAPAMLRAFHSARSAMGFVFGAGNFGFLLGSLTFGFIGDRFGRKAGVIAGVLCYSLPVLATVFATSLAAVGVLRFLTGIGLGGVFPTTISLLSESAPRRFRASFVTCAFIGFASGNSTSGQLGASLIGPFGWQAMFLVAGTAGLVLSVLLALWLPESVRFLVLQRPQSRRLRETLARLAPGLLVAADARFVLNQPQNSELALRQLFAGRLRLATPLLWVNYFAEGIMYLTLLGWLPTFMEALGLPPQQASLAFSYATAGGILGILVLGRLLDRFGPFASVLTALGAIAGLAYLGTPGLAHSSIVLVAVSALACATATHSSLHGTVGHFYPTAIRSNGVGYAIAMSRFASILGPIATGYLLSAKLPIDEVLHLLVSPYVLVVLCCIGLGRLYAAASEPVADEAARAKPAVEGGLG